MPTLPQQQTIVQYLANASQTVYTFAFYAPEPTDIQVYLQAPNALPVPAADILVLNVNYTVTYNVDPTTGGFITLLAPPTTGWYLTIVRDVAATLTTNFYLAQNINGADLDAAFDRLLLLCQQNLNYNLERNLSYVINSYLPISMPYTQLPVLPLNNIWIGTADGVVAGLLAPNPSASLLQSMLANNAMGTDGARLVGYYDVVNNVPTTVQAFLSTIWDQPNIIGVTNGVGAPAGSVGEIISLVIPVGSPVAFSVSTTVYDLGFITLSPGQWEITGNIYIFNAAGSMSSMAGWASTASVTVPSNGHYSSLAVASGIIGQWGADIPSFPINVSVSTPIYLSGNAAFASGTVSAWGAIYAQRVR
jgi:hypothetical protein